MGVANATYLSNRQKYARPHGIVFANSYTKSIGDPNNPTLTNYFYPEGVEYQDFIVLSDHNREEISIDTERIETRKRMINGRMRSVWLADKIRISTSWKDLPSRAAPNPLVVNGDDLNVNPDQGDTAMVQNRTFVVDQGAGAYDLAKWHKEHPGSFWVLLAFDQGTDLNKYTVAVECFFDSFDYSISKRGRTMDLWNVNLSLEEA